MNRTINELETERLVAAGKGNINREAVLAQKKYETEQLRDTKRQNEENLSHPEDLYLFGVYKTCKGDIWIITNRATENPGENVTTVLFPDEY